MRERERIQWVEELEARSIGLAEERELDAMLAEQEGVREVVQNMAEDTVSLAWRSQLNERLLLEQPKPARQAWWLSWKPAAGLALAGALAMVAVSQRPFQTTGTAEQRQPNLAAHLLEAHEDSLTYKEIAGAGLSVWETEHKTATVAEGYDWQYVDLDTL